MKLFRFLAMSVMYYAGAVKAQDTLRITLPDAEKQFFQNNLSLLAGKYNIDIAKAQIVQAKLHVNPQLSLTGNLYNPALNRVFDVSNRTGQYDIGLQQLVRLAGKRNKEIKLAEANAALSEAEFYDLMRTLRFSLRSEFYNCYYLQRSVNYYNEQIGAVGALSQSYDALEKKDVVTLKDALRIKSLLYSLQAEQANLSNQLNDSEAALQLMLHNNGAFIFPVAGNEALPEPVKQLDLAAVLDTAYANRYDLKAASYNLLVSKQNYALQKALAKTDLTIGAEFDKRGSFVDNASFLTVAFDLPFFKRNQGNIRSAKLSIDQSTVGVDMARAQVQNDVQKAYAKIITVGKLLQAIDPAFIGQSEKLMQGVTENFRRKNISLIEFCDFTESYKNNVLQFNQLYNDRMQAIEALQFAVGKTIINN